MDGMLSDNLRRLICRSGFVLLCAIPTLVCLKWSVWPLTSTEWAARLQQQFGVINEIEKVVTASPRQTRFQRVRLGGDRFPSRLTIDHACLDYSSGERTLHLGQATGSVAAFWNSLERVVETVSWSGRSDRPVRIRFDRVTLLESDRPESATCVWNDLVLRLENRGRHLTFTFECDQHTDLYVARQTPPVQVERTLDENGATWRIKATGYEIPAWVFRDLVPACDALNTAARLADAWLDLNETNGQWSGQISGRLYQVALQEVVANRFGRLLTGEAAINLDSVTLANNRIETLQGSLYSPSGLVGTQLLRACADCLGMEIVEPFASRGGEEAYSNLSFEFQIRDFQVVVNSRISDSLLHGPDHRKMLIARQGQPYPVSSLIRLLARSPEQMNASAVALAGYLTLPAIDGDPDVTLEHAARPPIGEETFFHR